MFIHTFAFRWKPAATQADKDRALHEIRAFQGHIPGLLETMVGVNLSPRSLGYELCGVMKFPDQATCDRYTTHPAHQQLLAWLMPLIEPVEIDFEI